PVQTQMVLEKKALQFQPDMVIEVGHFFDAKALARFIAERLADGVEPPYNYLRDAARYVGAGPQSRGGGPGIADADVLERRLTPMALRLLGSTYIRMVEVSRARGAQPVFAYVPL